MSYLRYNGFVLLGTLTFGFAQVAAAQSRPTAPSTPELKAAKGQCPNAAAFHSSHLEDNPTVLAAAKGVATQMVGRYNGDPTTQPDMTDQWGNLDLAIIAAADPSCIAKTVSNTKDTTAAKAKATTAQTNKQVAAPPSSDASTSPVQKVGIPQLLGVAVENGAVTNNVTGTTMTLSSSPYGFATAFRTGSDTQSNYQRFSLASQVGVSATFNVSTSTNALASATRKQVSQWQVKGTFRDTSVRSSEVNSLFTKDLLPSANAVVSDASNQILGIVYRSLAQPTNAVYSQAWGSSLKNLVSQAPAATDTDGSQKVAGVATKLLQLLDNDATYQTTLSEDLAKQTSDLSELIEKYEADSTTYLNQEAVFEKDVANIAKGWNGDVLFGQRFPTTVTTTTTTTSPAKPKAPDYLIGELDITCDPKSDASQHVPCLFGGHTSFTGNFSATFYTAPNSTLNETTFRGAQAGLQWQWKLGAGLVKSKAANDKSQMTLSLSGTYQRLQENKDQSGKRPDIVLGTIDLEIPIAGGTSLPLSFSVANATNQVKGTYVKGNFGLTFDLDKLASLLKAGQ